MSETERSSKMKTIKDKEEKLEINLEDNPRISTIT